jgi:hypothetical protein
MGRIVRLKFRKRRTGYEVIGESNGARGAKIPEWRVRLSSQGGRPVLDADALTGQPGMRDKKVD